TPFAAANGVRVVLNPSPVADVPADVLAAADPVIVNEHEYDALPEGLSSVCLTLGARGAQWGEASATPPPVEVVDTTGAGDCFAGTLAAALANGMDQAGALEAAVRASAEATTWHGAQPPIANPPIAG
ncbi:PfkB family carbohydrate kinase, partial [Sciscionella sediminilitoris]|uniref:PfkB family carbohydrate kinase n=1 Tax=Sciscionella sediminilitoris TaxID=1445613 RepID=UPI0004DF3C2B